MTAAAPPTLPTLQVRHRPGIIELGPGQPDPALLPVRAVRDAVDATLEADGVAALSYGAAAGPGRLREWLAAWVGQREGRLLQPGEVLITGGASSALAHVCQAFTAAGDVVLCESPTYHLAARTLRDHRLSPVGVATDGDGIVLAALEESLASVRSSGGRVSLLYTVPAHNNPTGRTTTSQRRERVLEIAAREGVLLVEDDVYRELTFEAQGLPALGRSPAEERGVVRLGSFAKLVAPGLRVGWLTAPRDLVSRLAAAGWLDSGGGTSHFAAMALTTMGGTGAIDHHITRLCAAYAVRRDALVDALRQALPPGSQVVSPAGGFFVWATLPGAVDAAALLPRAEAAGVGYVPGARFGLPGAPVPHSSLRLAFCAHPAETLREGARRLGQVVVRPAAEAP